MTNWKTLAGGVALTAMSMAIAAPAMAQVTTASIRGTVTTEDGAPVGGAAVVVTHVPSGTVSTASTNASGTFSTRNLRVGGPYSVSVSGGEFTPVEVTDIYVNLDETFDLPLVVSGAKTLDKVVVTAPALSSGYLDTGISTSLGLEELGEVVSIDRDITDAAELDPFAAVNVQSGGPKELSIAGANNRFNSLTIDGIKLNDRFGLNANGYPTQRSPISFDAIESLQIESAPMDVEFNGFTGGTVNAVTKSGTNEFHGSAFYFSTNDNFSGDRIGDEVRELDFEEETYGFTLGGPILKDKLFFFVSYDFFEEAAALQNDPLERGITQAELDQITQIAADVYGFQTGDFSKPPVEDEKILASLDWNITNDHRAKFTYIKTEGSTVIEQNGNNFILGADVAYSSSWYNRSETVEAFIGHVFSDWTPNFSTEVKIASTTQATGQDSLLGAETPLISIGGLGGGSRGDVIAFGPDRFRHGNELDQDFMQYKFKAEYLWGDHTFKFGFEREEVDMDNLFAQNSEGTYAFNSIADFQNNTPSRVTYDNAITNDENDLRAIWGFNVNSLYVQDSWDVNDALTVLFGLRYDWYETEGEIRQNDNFESRYGFTNTLTIDGMDVFMPRFGFTYQVKDNITLRGGLGRFSGGSPGVWLSNNYSNDGVINETVDFRSTSGLDISIPTTPDATTGQYLSADVLAALSGKTPDGPVNAMSPDFEIPSTWKANLGVQWDVDFPFSEGWTFTGDVLYNKLENSPYWYDPRCTPASVAPDGRPVYDCASGPSSLVVSSVDKGESLLWAVSASKEFENGFDLFMSYTNQDVKDIGMGTSSTASSNYSDSARYDYQNPREQTSRYQVEHMFKLRLDWEKNLFFKDHETKVSLFATRRTGQPYSYTFEENNNCVFVSGGGRCAIESAVDDAGHLFYVPSGPNDPLFAATSFGGNAADQQAFFDYIDNSELAQYKGSIAPANEDNSRWSTIVDLRLQQKFPGAFKGHETTFFMDIENLGNLINDDWGRIERTEYEYERRVASARIVNGQYEYFGLQSDDAIKNLETLNQSLWQIQFGLKYEF